VKSSQNPESAIQAHIAHTEKTIAQITDAAQGLHISAKEYLAKSKECLSFKRQWDALFFKWVQNSDERMSDEWLAMSLEYAPCYITNRIQANAKAFLQQKVQSNAALLQQRSQLLTKNKALIATNSSYFEGLITTFQNMIVLWYGQIKYQHTKILDWMQLLDKYPNVFTLPRTMKTKLLVWTLAQCTYKKFRVTSYYSPVEGQDFYYRSNVQDEWTLNGRWIAWASWAPVFNGMIAAPSSYAFGTKIYFPGWGIGQVEDRWWAIVHKWERNQQYDRIDIWAWKGEEWLERALSFGVQYLDAYICPKWAIPQKIGFDYDRFPSYSDFFERMLWILALEPGREDKFVKSLQRYLVKLWYLDSSSTTGNRQEKRWGILWNVKE